MIKGCGEPMGALQSACKSSPKLTKCLSVIFFKCVCVISRIAPLPGMKDAFFAYLLQWYSLEDVRSPIDSSQGFSIL